MTCQAAISLRVSLHHVHLRRDYPSSGDDADTDADDDDADVGVVDDDEEEEEDDDDDCDDARFAIVPSCSSS